MLPGPTTSYAARPMVLGGWIAGGHMEVLRGGFGSVGSALRCPRAATVVAMAPVGSSCGGGGGATSSAHRGSAVILAAAAPAAGLQQAVVLPGLLLGALAASARRRGRRRGATLGRRAVSVPITSNQAPKEARDYVQKGKRIEVFAPSKRWREAEVCKVHPDGVTVHYAGYDAQFDEKIRFDSDRIRPFGELKKIHLKNLKDSFVFQSTKSSCPGCGVPLQCENPQGLGYIPQDKFEPAEGTVPGDSVLSLEEEVRMLLQEDGVAEANSSGLYTERAVQATYKIIAHVYLDIRKEPDINAELSGFSLSFGDTFDVVEIRRSAYERSYFRLADGRGWVFDWAVVKGTRTQLIAPVEDGMAKIREQKQSYRKVCQRCWSLWQYNECDEIFRPAFGKQAIDELTADSFKAMLTKTLEPVTEACILAVVDVFDFGPSFKMLQYLARQLKGKKQVRVRVVANKVDLLPPDVCLTRIRGWVAREAQEAGLSRVKLTDVYPVSCHRQTGIKAVAALLEKADAEPEFYFVGAANAGKSSLLNRLALQKRKGPGQLPAQAADGFMVSCLPGTTIRPLTVKYNRGKSKLVDTPGLLLPGNFAERLTLEDLKEIIPQTAGARRVTLHMDEGRSLLLGALARIDMVEGRPYQFTVFSSEKVKIHRTTIEKSLAIAERFAGDTLTPPLNKEHFAGLQPWDAHRFEVEGAGWDESCVDIVFHGLGWVSITGCGPCVVEAHAPKGVSVTLRQEPLMPFEAKWTGVKYQGWPGWFKIGKWSTRGNDAGIARRRVKGKKF